MVKNAFIVVFSLGLLFFIGCNNNDYENIFDGNIVGTKWNAYYWDYDQTLVFETNDTGYVLDNRLHKSPIIYVHFSYLFDNETWIGKFTETDNDYFSEDEFYVEKNGSKIQLKNMEWELKE